MIINTLGVNMNGMRLTTIEQASGFHSGQPIPPFLRFETPSDSYLNWKILRRRELFDRQDEIQANRDGLIDELEKQLKQHVTAARLFAVEWEVL